MTIWPEMPDCGVYLVWPCDGTDWIHPEELPLPRPFIAADLVQLTNRPQLREHE